MRKKCVLVILVSILFFSALDNTQTFRAEISPTPTISQQEHFIVQQTFWAFGGTYAIGSFSANSGDYLVLNISSVNVDPDRPDDLYVVELDIVSAKHGTSYVSDTQFSQAIPLNYTDHYTITAEKHQFWSSVRISGELTVIHNPMPLTTTSPSPTRQPTIEPSPTPIIDYYYWWLSPTVWAFAIACLFIALFAELKLRSRNRIKQKRDSNEKKNISKTNATLLQIERQRNEFFMRCMWFSCLLLCGFLQPVAPVFPQFSGVL
jgi:hypothetical protein